MTGVGKTGKDRVVILGAIWIGLLIFVWPGAAIEAPAAADDALLRGTIQDASGRPVAGARVTARNLSSDLRGDLAGALPGGLTHSANSNADGQFEIADLPPGTYHVEVAANGAGAAEPQQVELGSGKTHALTFVLRSGSGPSESAPPEEELRERAEEEASPAPAASGNLIRESQLVGLPLNGRSYSQLATLQSDVSDTAAGSASRGTGGGNLTMGGGRSMSNNFLLDGTGIMNAENQVPRSAAGVQLGSDTVFQVQVMSGYYGAEYGRSSGGVLNSITRSGTPQFHGTFFEYFRNSKLDARNFFDKEANPPPFKRNQFGFTLTGPLFQDKTFFMAGLEVMRDRLSETAVNFFPDELARQGQGILTDQDGNPITIAVDPRVRPYLALFPISNDLRLGRGIGRHLAPQFQPTNENFLTVRVDHKLTERDSFFARYTFDDASSRASEDTYLFQSENLTRQQFLTLVGIHTFSPRTLTSFRFGYTRPVNAEEDASNAGIPQELFFVPGATRFGRINIPGLSGFGPNGGSPQANILNSFQVSDDVILQRGPHGIKLGFEVHRYRTNVFNNWGKYGWWSFNSLEDFLQAGPVGTSLWVALPGSDSHHGFRQTLAGFYVQDEYRVRPNVQLTLGLRYEFVTQIRDTQNRIPFLKDPVRDTVVEIGKYSANNPGLRNFAPRVSVSWSPGAGGNTNVSGGFGVYYDQVLPYTAVPLKNSAPFYKVVNRPNFDASPFFQNGILDAFAAAAVPEARPQVQVMDYNGLRTPMILRYNFSLRRQLPGGWNAQAAYGGARGNRLFRRYEANQFPVPITEPDGSLFFPPNRGAVNPAFGTMNILSTDAQSFYNSLQLSAGRNVGRGISLQAGYSYGKSVDDVSGLQGYNLQYGIARTLERGLSDFDLRHRLVFNYFYTLPFGGGQRGGATGILTKALGGWRVGGIASLRTGNPFTPQVNIRRNDYLFSANRPDLLPAGSNNPTAGVSEGCGRVAAGRELGGPDLYFDPCSFAAPAAGRLGNLGRNTVIAPRVFSMDFSLQREFFLDARRRLQFRAELFNLPNHTNFGPVAGSGLTVFSGESGSRTSTAGRISRTATTSRQIQFALRFSF